MKQYASWAVVVTAALGLSGMTPALASSASSPGVRSAAAHDSAGSDRSAKQRPGTTKLVSQSVDGGSAAGPSANAAVSADGGEVAFASFADDVDPSDETATEDVFLWHRRGATQLVDRTSAGVQGDALYFEGAAVSADGRAVAFASLSDDLDPFGGNAEADIFTKMFPSGELLLDSVALGDGPADGGSFAPALSADATVTVFNSYADDLVVGDTNGYQDVFVRNGSNPIELVSVGLGGRPANRGSFEADITADGDCVVFNSVASNLVVGDTNGRADVFLRCFDDGTTTLISHAADGGPANSASESPSISPDGRYISYDSLASNIVPEGDDRLGDIFVFDTQTGTTTVASVGEGGMQADGNALLSALSDHSVAFQSTATNLVADDGNGASDVFVFDLLTSTTTLVSRGRDGSGATLGAYNPDISDDGQYVVFESGSDNLVRHDRNDTTDVFITRLSRS